MSRTRSGSGAALTHVALLGLVRQALADLPIHCTLQDAAGEWKFHLGPAKPIVGRIQGCGHSIPNSVTSMLGINNSAVVPAATAEELSVTLSEEIVSEPMRHLKASDSTGATGSWTMVFDEGFEARVGGRWITAHFLFEALADPARAPKNGDTWDKIGAFHGRVDNGTSLEPKGSIYACHCNVTSTGWWHRRKQDGSLEGGCMWGSKKQGPGAPTAPTLVRLWRPKHEREAAATPSHVAGAVAFGVRGAGPLGEDRDGSVLKEVLRPKNTTAAAEPVPREPRPAARSLRSVGAHTAGDASDLPKSFDWRDELAGMVPPGQDPLGEQIDQGPCGSCYAFAGVMTLQMRFRVKLFREKGLLYPVELSYKSAARCSPYTEGCDGGFSYFTSRVATEIGVPTAACDKDVSAGAVGTTCDWKCYTNNTQLFFAKDYWHVGGFSHGSDEASIMREIYQNGPVELGFSTTAVPEFVVLSGQSHMKETEVMTIINNKKTPKEPYSTNPDIHRWWYSTHAILAVGWGEDTVGWGMIKYWTVRNSWGRDWGVNGYAKMRRGNNDGGIETDASMVVPDLDRLPPGFLEEATKYNAMHAKDFVAWKAAAKQASKVKGKAGLAEYCKTRPNSPDCK